MRLEPVDQRFVSGFESLLADPQVIRFTRVPTRPPRGYAARWVDAYVRAWRDGSRAGFAIVGEADGRFLGMASLVRVDLEASEGEIGYVVAPAARGRGIAGRAIRLLAGWAFADVGLVRLEAWIDVVNRSSIRAIERAGFTFEGVRRSVHFKEDLRSDFAVYSLLPGELDGGGGGRERPG